MKRYLIVATCLMLALCFVSVSLASAAEGEKAGGFRAFWRKLFNYPAQVTQESAKVTADAGKRSVDIVANETKRVGEVTSGDFAKTKELVMEPITGTAETTVDAVKGTAMVPVEAAKDEPASKTE
jgi:uncharacterized protein involved in propanediol utilization